MSLLDRLNMLIRSEINDLSRGSTFRSAMSEMESSLKDARRQRAELRRSEANLIKQIREARDKAQRWEERAMLALKHGDEDLAREALVMKNRSLDTATRMRDELDDYRSQIEDIEHALEALEMKLEGARGRIEDSRSSRSSSSSRTGGGYRDESAWDREMRRRMRQEGGDSGGGSGSGRSSSSSGGDHLDPLEDMTDDFGSSRSFREFDRMSSKINAMEADIDAMRELADDDPLIDPRRRELEDIFGKMERKKRMDDDLADLKDRGDDDLADLKKKFE